MKNILIVLAICLVIFWWKKNFGSPHGSKINMSQISSASVDYCVGKKICALVYVTPWCPACKQLSPMFGLWLKNAMNNPEYGAKIIIGLGKHPGDNEAEAQRYGGNVILDNDKSIHNSLPIKAYPTILLISPDGKISDSGQDAMNWANKNLTNEAELRSLMNR